jgi:hypothetical protein
MFLSARRPDASLLEFLADRARGSSARRLAVDLTVGAGILVLAIRWDSGARLTVALAATCLIAYAGWGLLHHTTSRLEVGRWRRTSVALNALRMLFAVAGVLAALGVLLAIWALALGTWIS